MKNMKFLVEDEDQSKALQAVLFSLGYDWLHRGMTAQFTKKLCIFASEEGLITHSDIDYFDDPEVEHYEAFGTETFIAMHTAKPEKPDLYLEDAYDAPMNKISTIDLVKSVQEFLPQKAISINAADILNEAAAALNNRATERDHEANGERSMARCVESFNAMTGHHLSVTEGWLFLVFLKMSRSLGGAYRKDDYVDMAAYAALAGEEAASGG